MRATPPPGRAQGPRPGTASFGASGPPGEPETPVASSTGEAVSRAGTVADLRLAVPALLAWAVLAAVLARDVRDQAVIAVAALGVAGPCVAAAIRGTRGPWRALALTLLVVAGVVGTAAGHHAARTAGPVPHLAQERGGARLEGIVHSDPRRLRADAEHPRPRTTVRLLVRTVDADGARTRVRTPVLLVGVGRAGDELARLHWWERVRLEGKLSSAEPGQDVEAVVLVTGGVETLTDSGPGGAFTEHVRGRLREAVAPLPADAEGLVPALVLGDRSLTPPDLSDAMKATGMSHLSAVSGSNTTLVLGAVMVTLGACGCPRRWRPYLGAAALAGFVALARPDPSVLRAAVMGSVGLLGMARNRRAAGMPALGAAVIVLLLTDPWLSRSFGFTLSVLATFGLLVFARPWADALAAVLPQRLRLLADATAVALAAGVVTAPVVVLLSGSVSFVSVAANVAAAPFVAPATVAGVLAAVAASVWTPAGTLVAWVAGLPAWGIALVARAAATVPHAAMPWRSDAVGALGLAVLVVLVVLVWPRAVWSAASLAARMGPGLRRVVALVAVLVIAGAAVVRWWPAPRLDDWRFVACDVGQGDALVIATGPGRAVVVDAGPDAGPVEACLDDLEVRQVDAVVLTHYDADHVGGVAGISRGRSVSTVLVSPVEEPRGGVADVTAWANGLGARVAPLVAGDRLRFGEVGATVLSPGRRIDAGSVPNNSCLVLDVDAGGLRLLLLGDIEREGTRAVESVLAASGDGRPVDVLKVAHHGSSNIDFGLFAGVRAPMAVISVGAGNDYGHPAPATLRMLAAAGSRVLRTDTDGQIRIGRRDSGYVVDTANDGLEEAAPQARQGPPPVRRVAALPHRASSVAATAGTRWRSGVVTA